MKPTLRLVFPLILGLLWLATSACNGEASAQPADSQPAPPAPVATPIVASIPITRSYPAQVEPIERVELRPQVGGPIDSIHFVEGAEVTRGQLLFRIDPRPFLAALAEAEAALAQAEVDADAAQREAERGARLVSRNAIATEEAERRNAFALATAARVEAARAAADRARLNLSYTEVRSPIGGRIGRAEVTRGNLAGPETRLAVVVAMDPVYVRFDVDENTLATTGTGHWQHWSVSFTPSSTATPAAATIAFVENEIGQGTGTLRVRAKLGNHEGGVIPGMYGTASLTFGEDPSAILVREDVIGADQGLRYVLVADEADVLQYRPVTLGARSGELRVITAGLTATDRVVVNGLFRLRPGMQVAPQVTEMLQEN